MNENALLDRNENYYCRNGNSSAENVTAFAEEFSSINNLNLNSILSIDGNNTRDYFEESGGKNLGFNAVSALEVARQLAGEDEELSDEEQFVPVVPYETSEDKSTLDAVRITTLHIFPGENETMGALDFTAADNKEEIFGLTENDDEGSSCLGSSVTCSEASFELGRTEDFETSQLPSSNGPSDYCDNAALTEPTQLCANPKSNCAISNACTKINYRSSDSASTLIRIDDEQKTASSPSSNTTEKNNLSSALNCTSINLNIIDPPGTLVTVDGCFENAVAQNPAINKCSNVNNKTSVRDKVFRVVDINDELANLDTAMPQLNFDELEKHLNEAVKEREKTPREMLSEEVRRRLAFDYANDKEQDEFCDGPFVSSDSKVRHNRAKHKTSNMNMEICFVNDGLPSDDDDDDDDDEGEDWLSSVPKSLSAPNLGFGKSASDAKYCTALERSVSSSNDSEKRASELRRDALTRQELEDVDLDSRKCRLEHETKVMLTKAKQAAHMQMEVERQSKLKRSKSAVEEIVGVTLGKRKLTRPQLSRMCITQLLIIINDLHARIQTFNEELVHLLIERDTLHMEQDSMLVDVQDLLQHQRKDDVKVPDFVAKLINLSTNNGLKKQFSFKILKKVIPFSQVQSSKS